MLGGTNGEGPSLSAVEKRDLVQHTVSFRGKLDVILGIATPSLDEAIWLCKRASEFGASRALVMPPGYFRAATERGILDWFLALLDKSPVPILVYNYPKMTGFTFSASAIAELAQHENFAGLKDSSGEVENILGYRSAITTEHQLLMGNELLLPQAMAAGWTGSISGAANVVAPWLAAYLREWSTESGETKFEILRPVLKACRELSQPAANKWILNHHRILARADLRLPLTEVDASEFARLIEQQLGISADYLGILANSTYN